MRFRNRDLAGVLVERVRESLTERHRPTRVERLLIFVRAERFLQSAEVAVENLVRKLFLGGSPPTGHYEGANG